MSMDAKAGVQGHGEGVVGDLADGGKQLAQRATMSPLMERLMRLGYLVRGLIYFIIGALAVQMALGNGGQATDQQGAISVLGGSPAGDILLYIILAGLIGYALWGFVRAIADPLRKGSDLKGIVERVGYAASGISYGLLAFATYRLITAGGSGNGGGGQTQEAAASAMSQSWGPLVVGAIGVAIAGAGIAQVFRALRKNFDEQFQPYALSAKQRRWIDRIGRFGTGARGVVFTLTGVFLLSAVLYNDPSRAQGIDGVLQSLLSQPNGLVLLGIVAAGLVAFGLYSMMSALWLRLKR